MTNEAPERIWINPYGVIYYKIPKTGLTNEQVAALEEYIRKDAACVEVKPLEWSKTVDGYRGTERREQWIAETLWGDLFIWHYQFPKDEEENGPIFSVGSAMTPFKPTGVKYSSLEEAKGAAQADYESRILALQAEELRKAKAEAWDEGFSACEDPNLDIRCNPYRNSTDEGEG